MFPSYPFKILSLLSDSTLTTNIRERTWELDNLFVQLKATKSKLSDSIKNFESDQSKILELRSSIGLLSREIIAGFKDLKLINFYDSAILYLYYKTLHHLLHLCRKEERSLMGKTKEALTEEAKIKDKMRLDVKKAKNKIEEKIKEYEKLVNGFEAAKKDIIKAYENLFDELHKRRWDAEKQAQHEFALLRYTFRRMKDINRKIKVVAMKVKAKIIPQEIALMKEIKRREINPRHIEQLAKLISKAIDRISKDIFYSSQLISKFDKEAEKIKKIVENLKKSVSKNKKIKEETANNLFKSWDEAIEYLKGEIDKDLIQIFRNIFVEYKYVGTRRLAA